MKTIIYITTIGLSIGVGALAKAECQPAPYCHQLQPSPLPRYHPQNSRRPAPPPQTEIPKGDSFTQRVMTVST